MGKQAIEKMQQNLYVSLPKTIIRTVILNSDFALELTVYWKVCIVTVERYIVTWSAQSLSNCNFNKKSGH